MIGLGLDISSSSTGWVVLKHGRFYKRLGIDFGMIKPKKTMTLAEKLVFFREELITILDRVKPEIVTLEDVYMSRNPRVFKILSEFHGVAIETIKEVSGIDALIETVSFIRAVVVGAQGKEETFSFIIKKFNLDWDYDTYNDVTDALAVALYAHKTFRSV